ncbi:MAG: RNA 2',3'-cyclic phosphodiesterase [Candidatus Aenigmarchaeota archaeon]|nr:RNA 2',3'-cyclic phosphodiesterase [Candidatus Aenigmarchaeota archaeon]
MVRCFIGFLIPEEIKKDVEAIKDELSKLPIKCKFVERENLHVCFSFLGEVEEKRIEHIIKTLDSICSNFKSFEVFIDGIKAIPSVNYIRVLALDVIEKNENLKNLIEEIRNRIGGDTKPPHLTLCRVKGINNKEVVAEKIEELKKRKIGILKIMAVQLIKSELRRAGPLYSVIHESKFKE